MRIGRAARAGVVAVATVIAIAAQGPTAAASQVDGLCAWPVRDNADLVNVAFPDESSHYWGTVALGIPETGMVIRGRYPEARYFSLHTYNPGLGAYDGLTDREIEPAQGSNPFVKPSQEAGGTWKVTVLPGERPANPAPNTLYVGSTRGLPSPASIVLYRVYVPDDPQDPEGGAGLPTVTPIIGGAEAGFGFAGCSLTTAIPETGINELIKQMNWPDGVTIPSRGAANPPTWHKFFSFGSSLARLGGVESLGPALEAVLGSGGLLNNLDNDYMSASISREFGEVVVLRAKMPSFPDTRAGEPAWRRSQVRYWSICQNHSITQRFVDCLADHESVRDDRRRATFVISDPEDRPANATGAEGVNWLPWGGTYPSGLIIYRQMLASPNFKRALAPVERGDSLEEALGPYLPRIAYCTTERFERDGPAGCLAG